MLCLIGVILYAMGLPPFGEEKGNIKAAEVCRTLGPSTGSAAALKKILPDKSSYAFDDAITDARTDDMDFSYATSCFVDGDGKQLVAATAEMLQYDTADEWVKDVVEESVPASSVKPFSAGDKAVASDKIAAVYVPCVVRGRGQHLSIVVELKQRGNAGDEQLREGLISLARNAALFAHHKAKCDAPSKVTG
ncbi:hypothetical protein QWJ26_40030 [Streptomyces sp. CSDS2]|uniref:hypothetical protein n=1 Tax=Streptomyces sp. CSDS2 TaxID=3055051 RepID=UPI0025B049CD|nr:hypothetical protein [Streptomyces sp. CSDS2]MDN3265872.1 hypothetical protein [Streptomyces sp. CSDS2]